MKQDEQWNEKYLAIMYFMNTTKRCPSKHRIEEHRMLNWIKYNKKAMAAGKLKDDRLKKFNEMLQLCESLHRKNQYDKIEADE